MAGVDLDVRCLRTGADKQRDPGRLGTQAGRAGSSPDQSEESGGGEETSDEFRLLPEEEGGHVDQEGLGQSASWWERKAPL